jgi:hypothetical protein
MSLLFSERESLAAQAIAWCADLPVPRFGPREVVRALDALGYLKEPADWPGPRPQPPRGGERCPTD